ncbi:unnamed protein product [Brassicogethes aeneus]|uniref:Cap-specific mRNA (nucleoside-2'-O-)-methyltransferase 1 n=1 Tax=Brassicogethes aeneus TaxID=1431903 RepID=A0A9P0AQD6_BRAAE|nr:unnamed protein product [Brassicogethes aeneus]
MEVLIKQKVVWLKNNEKNEFLPNAMVNWIKEGSPKTNIDDEHNFCDKDILYGIQKGKEIFDKMDFMVIIQARTRANPFESIRSAFFMNRAALKMANIDSATDFLFTDIQRNDHFLGNEGPFYFADVCAGPGGFTEYILWRTGWIYKGLGFTLKDAHDFKLNESTCTSSATFQALYGKNEDGNICNPENISDFKEKILAETNNKGVHFMMSDGGFSVEGNEHFQEVLSKNIYICQCLVALEIVRKHGNFVTKLFDVFTPFSIGLLYLMYQCFTKVSIFKPNASRPANSERYFICQNLKENSQVNFIKEYLWKVVKRLWEFSTKNETNIDILSIVPLEVIIENKCFYDYIVESNNNLGLKQIKALQKLREFCLDPLLIDPRQEELKEKSLEYWKLPNKIKILKPLTTEVKVPLWKQELLVQPREICNVKHLELTLNDVEDWFYCPMYCPKNISNCYFYAGVGYTKVYRFQKDKWVKVKNLQLNKGTLLYAEFVKEKNTYNGNSKTFFKYSLHVIDAVSLGEKILTNLKFFERSVILFYLCTKGPNIFIKWSRK